MMVMSKLLEMKEKLQLVVVLKIVRQFYRSMEESQSHLYSRMATMITENLLEQLYTEQLPWYAIKPVLKTLFLFRKNLPSSIAYRGYLSELATQTKNKEITYWTTRLLVAIAIHSEKEEDRLSAKNTVMEVMQNLDINLSYRAMMADIAWMIRESEDALQDSLGQIPAIWKGIDLYTSFFLLRDPNPSLQEVAIRVLQRQKSGIPAGVTTVEKMAVEKMISDEELGNAYCIACGNVFIAFVEKYSPEVLLAEEKEV